MEPIRALQITSFMDFMRSGIMSSQFPRHVRNIGGNHLHVGIMHALLSLIEFLSTPIAGSLSDIYDRKSTMLVVLTMSTVIYFFVGLTQSVFVLILLRAFLGCNQMQLLTKNMIPDYEKDKDRVTASMRSLETLSTIAMAIGPVIGFHVVGIFPEDGFSILSFALVVAFIGVAGLVKDLPKKETKEGKKAKVSNELVASRVIESMKSCVQQTISNLYKIDWQNHGDGLILNTIILLCFGVYFNNFALYIIVKYQVATHNTGYFISIILSGAVICSYFLQYASKYYENDKDFTQRNFHIFVLLVISFLGMASAPTPAIYLLFVAPLSYCLVAGKMFTLEAALSTTKDSQRGTVTGIVNSIRTLTSIVAPLIAGAANQFIGVLYVNYICLLFALVGLVVSYRLRASNLSSKARKHKDR